MNEEENKKTVSSSKIDNKALRNVLVILFILVGGYYLYNYATLKTKCEKWVSFTPAGEDFEFAALKALPHEEYFSWGTELRPEKFESREAAIKDCVRENAGKRGK